MAQIINLRMARKARNLAGKQDQAAINRAKFGQSKAEKALQRLDIERAQALLDGAKREPD